MTSSWVKTITSPFRKACHTIFNNQQQPGSSSTTSTSSGSGSSSSRDRKSHRRQNAGGGHNGDGREGMMNGMDHLHGEVMACGYEDVQVMWSILDKPNKMSPPHPCNHLLVR